jgi:hypothetical protein
MVLSLVSGLAGGIRHGIGEALFPRFRGLIHPGGI